MNALLPEGFRLAVTESATGSARGNLLFMKMMRKIFMRQSTVILFLCGFLLIFNPFLEAWAYLDPGTGSMILQLLLGGIAGAILIAKLYWRRFLNLFKGKPLDSPPSDSSESD